MSARASLAVLYEEAWPGPWRPERLEDEEGPRSKPEPIWLTNDAGDSLCVDESDVALLINAVLGAPVR